MKQLGSLLKISVSLIIIFHSFTSPGSGLARLSAGAGEAGMGYACIMKNGFWTSFHNQASLAYNNSLAIGVNYENRFTIKELATVTAGITIPAGITTIGAVYSQFGYADFKREMTGLAIGMKLSEIISAGVQIDYYSEKTSGEYSNIQFVTIEAGLIITPSEIIKIGIHLFNPVPNSIRKYYRPASLRVGAGTDLSGLLFTGIEAEMSTDSKLIVRAGFQYKAADNVWLRGGYSTKNSSFSFGLGHMVKSISMDIGFTTHELLGLTSSVSLIFKIR